MVADSFCYLSLAGYTCSYRVLAVDRSVPVAPGAREDRHPGALRKPWLANSPSRDCNERDVLTAVARRRDHPLRRPSRTAVTGLSAIDVRKTGRGSWCGSRCKGRSWCKSRCRSRSKRRHRRNKRRHSRSRCAPHEPELGRRGAIGFGAGAGGVACAGAVCGGT